MLRVVGTGPGTGLAQGWGVRAAARLREERGHQVGVRQEFHDRSSVVRRPPWVWYAAYGSNMHPERLSRYLSGGTPPGGRLPHPGCRDPRPPRRAVPVVLRGLVYFATESAVWGGGRAFYDPEARDAVRGEGEDGREGEKRGEGGECGEGTPAHAYLVTLGQFSDIAAQEMGRTPGRDLDLSGVLRSGRARLGPGRYETLVCVGSLDGLPVLTFTAPRGWDSGVLALNAPSAAYLRQLGLGLMCAHGWDAGRVGAYLASRPGARQMWTGEAVRQVLGGA